MNPGKQPAGEGVGEIDVLGLYYAFRGQLWVIIVCAVVSLLGGALYLWWTPKVYEGQAVIQVDQSERRVVKIEEIDNENLESVEALKTLEQSLSNWTLLERVVRNPKLGITPAALGLRSHGGLAPGEGELIYKMSQGISVSLVRGTRLLSIKAEALDARVAGALPNVILEEYKASQFEMHNEITGEANSFLLGEVKRLSAKLQASKQALQDYRERTKAVSLEESRNITDARLRELNARVTEAKATRLRLEADYAQVQALAGKSPELLLNLASIADSPTVLDQKRNVTAQEAELANLSQRYKWKHPKYIQAQSRLEELRAGLTRAINLVAKDLGSSVESARATEQKFEDALREQEGKSLELGRLAIDYETLAGAVKTDTVLYESVLTRLNETDVTKNIPPESLRMITPATTPHVPAKPRKKLVLGLALMLGCAVGSGIAIARVAMDRSLHTVDQTEKLLDLPVLGSVPREKRAMRHESDLPIVFEPHGAVAEEFRTLRTSLALLSPPMERRTFLFTSAIPGEGKSFCAANYAMALAQQGLRTLLIDADMRLPALHKIFFNNDPHPGAADVLLGTATLASAARQAHEKNLFVLTAGQRPDRPAELLAGPRFAEMLAEAATLYDRIVIDSAPIHAVSDTLLLAPCAQAVVLVVRAARTPRRAASRAAQKLRGTNSPIAGVVLNQLPRINGRDYYYHYSHGSYGDGVYGVPKQRS
jgi:polysaccharide biosynthesis transport protein